MIWSSGSIADCTDAARSYRTTEKSGIAYEVHEKTKVRGSTRCSFADGTNLRQVSSTSPTVVDSNARSCAIVSPSCASSSTRWMC